MPNIIVTSQCNLSCPYCFSQTFLNNENIQDITIEQFNNILNWFNFSETSKNTIGLIGGEPTLHPQISDLLNLTIDYCQEYTNCKTLLYTNGIYLDRIIDFLDKIYTLININSPTVMTESQFEDLNNNFDLLKRLQIFSPEKIKLGCNICQEINDYSFFWDFIKNYFLSDQIVRVSTVTPINQSLLLDKDSYYLSLKDKFLTFINNAHKENVKVYLDCNQIPICYFSENELNFVQNQLVEPQKKFICYPVIDIASNFKAISCFGVNKEFVDCNNFANYGSLYNYFLYKKTIPLTFKNNQGKCKNCLNYELLECQGGCLAFAQGENS